MRRRLLLAILAVVATALVLFAVPLGWAVRGTLTDRAYDRLAGEATQVSTIVDQRARTCAELQLFLRLVASQGREVALFAADGSLLFAAGPRRPVLPAGEVREAAAGRTGRALADGRLSVAVPLSTLVCQEPLILRLTEPADALVRSVRGAWFAIGLVGLVVLGLGVAAAGVLGRRLSAPFEQLAGTARRLGDGDFSVRAERSGLPEADAIAAALDVTADRLGRAVQRGAAFTADASHQLRTPLTALRLHLEALEAGADPASVAAAALEEADRLEATIDELVTLTRPEAAAEQVDLRAEVQRRLAAWRSRAELHGRSLVLRDLPVPPVHIRPAAVGQALEVLLDNALEHGAGPIEVELASDPSAVRICVEDHGPGIDPDRALAPSARDRGGISSGPRGGHGLPLARMLVEGEGGRLVLQDTGHGTRACIVLPAASAATPQGER